MKDIKPVIWFGGAAVIFAVGAVMSSADVVLLSAVPGALGLGTLFLAFREKRTAEHAIRDQRRMDEMEERLRLTEDELDSAARELAAIKEQRDFDRQLQMSRSKPQIDASKGT